MLKRNKMSELKILYCHEKDELCVPLTKSVNLLVVASDYF